MKLSLNQPFVPHFTHKQFNVDQHEAHMLLTQAASSQLKSSKQDFAKLFFSLASKLNFFVCCTRAKKYN